MSDCFKKNNLILPGTRQDQRMQTALDPSYVLADERSLAELLVFISKYAELINYYAFKTSTQNNYIIDGDWKPLIVSDEAFNYAGISVTPYSLPNITFYKYINLYETGSTDVKRKNAYRVLWDVLFSLYKDIDNFYTALPLSMSLHNDVSVEISNGLKTDMGITANAYLNDAVVIPGCNLQIATSATDDDYKFSFGKDLLTGKFNNIWIDENLDNTATTWFDYINNMLLNDAPAKDFFNFFTIANDFDKIDYSTIQLKQIFKRAFEAYTRIITKANDYLQNSLQNNSAHNAHHGLMLAFLKLFDVVRVDMNAFTQKHLEYYYNRVLQINPAPAVPDAAHIIFEPAKNITSHLIEEDTALNAGKDGIGKLMLYDTEEAIVINQTKIEQLKTLFVKPGSAAGSIENIYASPVANSADGKGAPFTGEDLSWKGFGDDLNDAAFGFYIASPVLHLTEGTRIVDFVFTTDAAGIAKANALLKPAIIKMFSFFFSGEKKWEQLIIDDSLIADFNCELDYTSPFGTNTFNIKLTLLPQCKAVVGYDAFKCEGNLNTSYPVIKFVLNQAEPGAYEKLKNISITQINITTTVSEITNLSLQNDLGVLDATKPIQLFGPNPKISSAFYIGHPELEYKMISLFDITFKWLDYNTNLQEYYKYKIANAFKYYNVADADPVPNNSSFKASVDVIRNKAWKNLSTGYSIFEDGQRTIMSVSVSGLAKALIKSESFLNGILSFSPQTQNGFLKLTLNAPRYAFGHSTWPALFAQQTAAVVNGASANTVPNPPYTPTLESITLKYTATQQINLNTTDYNIDQGQFFHIMPFGIKETNENVTLLPSFKSEVKQPDNSLLIKPLESAVFIGISNTIFNQNISLLFQVSEGTEDISLDTPTVSWNYLSTDGWKNLNQSSATDAKNYLLSDATNNLVKSGIVKFQVPVDANTKATELQTDLLWISASIENNSLALPRMLAVLSNAVKVTFSNNNNDPEHLALPLPPNKITKLYESDSAVRKINQPYPSFSGKKTESGNKFYARVSERLRHKHRAITIWDYERLVLNEFPQVYMVKCLNHTGYEKDCNTNTGKYRENLPGNVMLVTIPFVTNLQSGDKFQPALSAALRTGITNFIQGADNANTCNKYVKALNCGLVKFKVENPKYETIKVSCKIKVKQCFDKNFCRNQLLTDLNHFLSPWLTGDTTKINFGGRLHVSQVIYFIEQLSYIDYVTNVTIEHRDESGVLNIAEPSFAVTTTSKSVLTSNRIHDISLL